MIASPKPRLKFTGWSSVVDLPRRCMELHVWMRVLSDLRDTTARHQLFGETVTVQSEISSLAVQGPPRVAIEMEDTFNNLKALRVRKLINALRHATKKKYQ